MYLILLFLICICWFIEYTYKEKAQTRKIKASRVIQLLVLLFSISLIGLRDITIGTDTIAYYNRFLYFKNFNLIDVLLYRSPEFGSGLLYWLGSRFEYGFRFILIFQAVFYIYAVDKIIKRYSVSYWFSFLLFVLMGFYTFSFSTMDQAMAMAFASLAFIANEDKRKIKTYIFMIMAILFHFSAVVFIPMLLLKKFKINKKTIILWVLAMIIVFLFKNNLGVILNNFAIRYSKGYETVETGGSLSALYYALTAILGIIWRNRLINYNQVNKNILIAIMIVSILLPITLFNPAVPRLVYYYSIFAIIFIPNLIHSIKDILTRSIIRFGFIAVALYLAFEQVFTLGKNIIPYSFFW